MDRMRLSRLVAPVFALLLSACEDPLGKVELHPADAGETKGDESPSEAGDARVDVSPPSDEGEGLGDDEGDPSDDPAPPEDGGSAEPEDGGSAEPEDAGEPTLEDDAGSASSTTPRVIDDAPPDVVQALCTNAYDSVKLSYANVTRGSWQYNPGGPFVKLSQPGYPCRVFLEDLKVRPTHDDPRWTDATDGIFLGFSESSKISSNDYTDAQFRYFRSLIFVPAGSNLKSLTISALGIDDAVYLRLTNSRYPQGISPTDVGPSDVDVGACQGNGKGEWNFAKYIAEGEINMLLLVHADMAAATSTLTSVDVRADDAPIQLVSCRK